jgi:hypothetical protein
VDAIADEFGEHWLLVGTLVKVALETESPALAIVQATWWGVKLGRLPSDLESPSQQREFFEAALDAAELTETTPELQPKVTRCPLADQWQDIRMQALRALLEPTPS